MGMEIVWALLALVAVGVFLLVVRRASNRQLADSGAAVRKRMREVGRDEEAEEEEREEEAEAEEAEGEEPEGEEAEEEEELEEEPAEAPEPAGRTLDEGLARTRGGFVARLGKLFAKKTIDDDVLEELEQVLFEADIGPKTAERLFSVIKKSMKKDELADVDAIWSRIREESATILSVDSPAVNFSAHKPFVLLTIGVNGVGKTTTIGKLAAKLSREGKKVLLAAGDTFRAAAVEQLEIWGQRSNADVVKGKSGGDPSSVIFDAIRKGADDGYDVVIADTAGRLHTKKELMDELKKVGRVCEKALPGAPHETWLVLDSTTGQNAIQQAQLFKEAMNITGIVLTKLDGTAKGGVILGICDEMKVPVRYIGIGEQVDDLRVFDPESFVAALYQEAADAA